SSWPILSLFLLSSPCPLPLPSLHSFPTRRSSDLPQLIIDTVAEHFHISPEDITSSKRSSEIVMPRQIVMYLCRHMLDIPLKSVGDRKSTRLNSSHVSISYAVFCLKKKICSTIYIQ